MSTDATASNGHKLEKAIDEVLKPLGFRRKRRSWYCEGSECVCVVNLQKSSFGEQYYINLGVSPRQLDRNPFPKEEHCHLRTRLARFVRDEGQPDTMLDFEDNSISVEERIATTMRALRNDALPVLLSCQTLEGIREQMGVPGTRNFHATVLLKNLLGIPRDF